MKEYKENFFIWILKKLGIIKTIPIEKKEMCERAQSICNQDCVNCAWYEEDR